MKKLLLLLFSISLSLICLSQNTSPLIVRDFMLQTNGIMDIEQVPRDARTDWDSNPVCMIQVKAVGFDENLMQKFIFVPNGMDIMYKTIKNGMIILYVSSNKMGEITIKHMGDCLFRLPYKLEGHKIYILTLGMESATLVINTVPTNADIFIDGEKVGTGYASKVVSIGAEHRYKVQCNNYRPSEDVVYFEKREKKELNVNLEPNFSYITIKTEPSGAEVYVDGIKVGETPYMSEPIAFGQHRVELRKTGYEKYAKVVIIKPEELENTQLENVKLIKDPNYKEQQVAVTTVTPSSSNRTFTVNGVTFEMVYVKGGTFTMGCTSEQGNECDDDEKPAHSVTLSDYYIGKYEVTVALFRAFVNETGYRTDAEKEGWVWRWMKVDGEWKWNKVNGIYWIHDNDGRARNSSEDNHPVLYVSWNDAKEFCSWLSSKTNQTFRLPTEAEWEYAARGGNKSRGYKYSGSNNINEVAWYGNLNSDATANGKTRAVGTKSPNELGIYDMTGNVCEWCQDWYGDYSSSSQTNPTGPSSGSYRVRRGGSWGSGAEGCRVSRRGNGGPGARYFSVGFRLVAVQ